MRMKGLFVAIALVAAPTLASAQHEHPPANADVDFGVLPAGPTGVPVPIGPLPCLQAGAIGGPNDPCSYKLHHLTPEETTIAKGGQVTFQIHGGGHGFAIYEVSKDTTREDLGQFLCAGPDPEDIADPTLHRCNLLAANAGRVVTREEILDVVWGTDFIASSNLVDQHIRALRVKLQNDWRRPRFIATVPGKGYRFLPTFTDDRSNGAPSS